jgi:hypothetical protein
MRIFTLAVVAAALAACSETPTGATRPLDEITVAASCAQPAPLSGTPDPRTGGTYVVVYHDSTDSPATTARLARKYGFTPRFVYQYALTGFAAPLTDAQVAGIRCEPETRYVQHDAVARVTQ